jgi:hypothetical protein
MPFPFIEPLEARIAPATLTIADPTQIVEGNSGTKTVSFNVTLSDTLPDDFTITFTTRNGTAVAGSDYVAQTGTADLGKTKQSAKFDVTVNGDNTFEPTESFFVDVTGVPAGVTVVNSHPVNPAAQATAVATILNDDKNQLAPNKVQWIDVDGDLVTLSVSKGTLPINSGTLFSFDAPNSLGGVLLRKLDFQAFGSTFAGANVSITATKQPGFTGTSDGRVDVGWIKASEFNASELQVAGVDLGIVTVDGDLGRITAGDQYSTAAVAQLNVYSLGVRGTATLPATDTGNESKFLGPIGSLKVEKDVAGFVHVIGAEFGTIGTLKIGGALKGGSVENSGVISVSGRVNTATIGSIVGGTVDKTGLLLASFLTSKSSLGTITVTGDVTGGSGTATGAIQAPRIGNVTIGGDLTGGAGSQSGYVFSDTSIGNVTVTGDIIGGTDDDAGEIAAKTTIGAVKIGGSVTGNTGANSGSVRAVGSLLSVKLGGALAGGDGESSGSIQSLSSNIGPVTIGAVAGKSITGGGGSNSGSVVSNANLTSITTAGTVKGGSGATSGGILVAGNIDKVAIGGSLIGGDANATTFLSRTGFISATRLKSVTIAGDLVSGVNNVGGLANSGAIRADVIDSLAIAGNVTGNITQTGYFTPVIIGATGFGATVAIKNLTIGGDAKFLEILAGYDINTTKDNFRGVAVNGDASIGTVDIGGTVRGLNIIAGAAPGADARFGTGDDVAIDAGSTARNDPKIISQIASVFIRGTAPILANPLQYGIVAQQIGSIKVGPTGTPVALHPGAGNDLTPVDLAPGGNFLARELLLI